MNSKVQHPFSIDFITRESLGTNSYSLDEASSAYGTGSSEGDCSPSKDSKCRQTPSPTDSGMESDPSPPRPDLHKHGKDSSIAEVLLSLEKNISNKKVKVTDDSGDDKPVHSYIALISMAILSVPERRMLLSDIYQYVMDNFPFYNNGEKAWRNSIRHNLSLNECFVKAGRADNGKGNYWSIHPACMEDFANGDFRRRQARRRARKSMKDTSSSSGSSAYRYNVGYVPMTASHIAYHPYMNAAAAAAAASAAASSLYYQQSQAFPALARPQTTSASAFSVGQSQASNNYLSACAISSQASPQSTMSIAFADQTNPAALTMQAFTQQQLASSLQFSNWC